MILLILLLCLSSATASVTYQNITVGNGIDLNVAFYDDPGPTMVILHGYPEGIAVWDQVASYLNPGYRLVIPSLRGYNYSSKPEKISDYNVFLLADDIKGLIDQVSPNDKVLLVAHDWGGEVGWVYSHLYPETLYGFAVFNAPQPDILTNLFANNSAQQSAAEYLLQFMHFPDETAYALSIDDFYGLKKALTPSFSEQLVAELATAWDIDESYYYMIYYYPANLMTTSVFSFSGFNSTFPKPCTVNVPTLFGWGMQDPNYIPANLQGIGQYVSNLTIKEYANAAHYPQVDIPQTVAQDIISFAQQLIPSHYLGSV